jgi:hypothetical protein
MNLQAHAAGVAPGVTPVAARELRNRPHRPAPIVRVGRGTANPGEKPPSTLAACVHATGLRLRGEGAVIPCRRAARNVKLLPPSQPRKARARAMGAGHVSRLGVARVGCKRGYGDGTLLSTPHVPLRAPALSGSEGAATTAYAVVCVREAAHATPKMARTLTHGTTPAG